MDRSEGARRGHREDNMTARQKGNFLAHLHPPMILERTLAPLSTLGLGIICLTCLILLAVTGLTLLLYYTPYEDVAYDRILHIITTLRYGRLIRNLHYLAANLLLIVGTLHLARVFFTGGYKERTLNWTYGLGLLVLILSSNYTGYLLPWDQTSYWAVKVGSSLAAYFPVIGPSLKRFLLGGDEIGPDTLLRSFALHVAALPALWLIFTSLHLWRIRKDGGLAAPVVPNPPRIPASPVLFRAEMAVALLTLSLLLALALFVDAPFSGRADPLRPPNPARAPWYFVGIQEMVSHSALIGGIAVPALIGFFLILTPVLDRSKTAGGRWFTRESLLINLVFAFVILSQVILIIVGLWFRSTNWALTPPWR
jgi:quinol-cytochrome oxidoreductase complex cytochrome b subunit